MHCDCCLQPARGTAIVRDTRINYCGDTHCLARLMKVWKRTTSVERLVKQVRRGEFDRASKTIRGVIFPLAHMATFFVGIG
jgi:hypothetical protein